MDLSSGHFKYLIVNTILLTRAWKNNGSKLSESSWDPISSAERFCLEAGWARLSIEPQPRVVWMHLTQANVLGPSTAGRCDCCVYAYSARSDSPYAVGGLLSPREEAEGVEEGRAASPRRSVARSAEPAAVTSAVNVSRLRSCCYLRSFYLM